MLRIIFIETGKFIRRMEFSAVMGVITSILGLILPTVPGNNINAFFGFKSAFELFLYVAGIVLLILFVVVMSQVAGIVLIQWGKNLKPKADILEYIQDSSSPRHISLRIINHEKDDLTECRARLIFIEQHYNPTTTIPLLDEVNPNALLMSWGGGSKGQPIIIPGNDGERVLNIGHEGMGGRLVFLFDDWKSDPQLANVKYRVKIKIDGKINGESFKALEYEGCFRSWNYIVPLTPMISYREGEDGEMVEARRTVYGGNSASRLEFLKCSIDDSERNENENAEAQI